MAQLEHIEAIEKRLWSAADTLRANSNYASNEYFLPVMGLVFLRHAYSRYLGVKDAIPLFKADAETFRKIVNEQQAAWGQQKTTNGELKKAVDRLATPAETSRDLVKQTDLLYKLACRLIETCENECVARDNDAWAGRDITRSRKAADEFRALAVEQLKQVRYIWKQAHWLTERFPEAELCDVEGLVKLVDRAVIEANDWSLTPGRYVGVAPEEEDEDFGFEEALRDIHVEMEDLNAEAVRLAATIKKNFEELGV